MKDVCHIVAGSSNIVHAVTKIHELGDYDSFDTFCGKTLLTDGGYSVTDQEVTCKHCLKVMSRRKLEQDKSYIYLAIDDDGTATVGSSLEDVRQELISTYGESELTADLEMGEMCPIKFFRCERIHVVPDIETVKYLRALREV